MEEYRARFKLGTPVFEKSMAVDDISAMKREEK